MQHRHAFEAVDRSLRDICERDLPFGRIPLILGGDFLQTLPVVPRGSHSSTVYACLLSSPLWRFITPNILKLERNMRLTDRAEDLLFTSWQRQLARGELNDNDRQVALPSSLLHPLNSLNELISHTYPDLASAHDDKYFLSLDDTNKWRQLCTCPRLLLDSTN